MAVSVADMNSIRVNVLGTTVDAPGAAWTTAPPAAANTLTTTQRIITRIINELDTRVGNALNGTVGFDSRFNAVVGNEEAGDQAAFEAIGSNLIQAVAALMAGGGVIPKPETVSLAFAFPDPLDIGDFVEVTVDDDCTIPADLAGTQYIGAAHSDEMQFVLTTQPSDDEVGHLIVDGDDITLSGIGGEIAAGTVLRMTADDVIGGPVSLGITITVVAEKKAAPPAAVGRFEFTQSAADTTWTIYHGLKQKFVSVQTLDGTGTVMVPDINYDTENRCILTFARPRAGTAVVRT